MPASAFVALLGVALLWGSAFPMIKIGLEGLSVPHLTVVRHLVASLAFVPLLLAFRARLRPEPGDVPRFLLLGFVGMFVYHTALNAGELRVSAGATSLIIAAAPVITAVLAHRFLNDRLTAVGWAGSLLGFGGVALIVVGDGAGLGIDPYAGFVLLAAVATSVYFVLQQGMFARYAAVEVVAFVTWGGTVPMVAFLPGLPAAVAEAPFAPVAAAAYIGLFPSAVAYTLFAVAQARAPVTQVTTMLYAIPLVSLALSWWWLGEVPSLLTLVGGAIVIVGIAVVRRSRRIAREQGAVAAG